MPDSSRIRVYFVFGSTALNGSTRRRVICDL
jgi:hypothetical protein